MPAPFPANPYRAAQSERLKALLQGKYSPNPQEQRNEIFGAPPVQYPEFIENIGSAANNFLSPVDYETGMPNVDVAGPVMIGKAGAKNAQKIFEELIDSGMTHPMNLALEFIRKKYPKLSSAVKNWGTHNDSYYGGKYYPLTNEATILPKENSFPSTYINPITHEMYHGVQDLFQGRKNELLLPTEYHEFVDPKNPDITHVKQGTYIPARKSYDQYLNQPVEYEANLAGSTGKRAYDNFMKIMESKTKEMNPEMRAIFNKLFRTSK